MPMRAGKPCRYPGCPGVATDRYCATHAHCENQHIKSRKQTNPELMRADRFYLSPAWRALRSVQLHRQPLCQSCLTNNRTTAAQMVDHIQPINQGGAKLNLSNLQSLCHRCHNQKRQLEAQSRGPTPKRLPTG